MKRSILAGIFLALILFVILAGIMYRQEQVPLQENSINANSTPQQGEQGKFFDENETQLGTCLVFFLPSPDGYGKTYYTDYYSINGTELGSCWKYRGQGESRGCRSGCDESLIANKIGTKIETGQCAGEVAEKYECKGPSID